MNSDMRTGRGLGKAAQGAETRARLVEVATDLFGRQGYAATGTETLLEAAGVTRGALYHHFADKADLMRAVCEALYEEVGARIHARASAAPDAWHSLLEGCEAFLEVVADERLVRLLFVEAPAALGWEEWEAIDRKHGFSSLLAGVEAAIRAGALPREPAEPLAVLLNGALNGAVFWAVRQPDPAAAVRAVRRSFRRMLDLLHAAALAETRRTR